MVEVTAALPNNVYAG